MGDDDLFVSKNIKNNISLKPIPEGEEKKKKNRSIIIIIIVQHRRVCVYLPSATIHDKLRVGVATTHITEKEHSSRCQRIKIYIHVMWAMTFSKSIYGGYKGRVVLE